jgi:hypothetical protein
MGTAKAPFPFVSARATVFHPRPRTRSWISTRCPSAHGAKASRTETVPDAIVLPSENETVRRWITLNTGPVTVPNGVVTTTGPAVAPPGTVAVRLDKLATENAAGTPSKLTCCTPLKFRPVTTMDAPTTPAAGDTAAIWGGAAPTKCGSAPIAAKAFSEPALESTQN